MTLTDELATSLNRRGESSNQELAKQIASSNDKKAAKELFENLHSKDKGIQSDCIKVIYETGLLKPTLVAGFANELVSLLDSKNNRLQWGAITALDAIISENPEWFTRLWQRSWKLPIRDL